MAYKFNPFTAKLDILDVTDLSAPGEIGGTTPAVGNFTTVNTGQGDNELYAMNQDVQTTDSPEFAAVNTPQVKAPDANGLLLTDDGDNGIFVKDGGNVGIQNRQFFGQSWDAIFVDDSSTETPALVLFDQTDGNSGGRLSFEIHYFIANRREVSSYLSSTFKGVLRGTIDNDNDSVIDVYLQDQRIDDGGGYYGAGTWSDAIDITWKAVYIDNRVQIYAEIVNSGTSGTGGRFLTGDFFIYRGPDIYTNTITTTLQSKDDTIIVGTTVSADDYVILTTNGNVGIGTTVPSAKLHVSGGNIKVDSTYGIDFSGTSDATGTGVTMASEVLDDYEEGTWTPGVSFGGSTTGITYNTTYTKGNYVKIGKIVILRMSIAMTSKGSATGNATITGIPFTAISSYSTSASLSSNYLTYNGALSIYYSSTSCAIIDWPNSNSSQTQLTDAAFENNTSINATFSYEIA